MITEQCYDLLLRMLTYDPKKRITAVEALQHPYFTESPRAKRPEYMPTWPSSHEGKKKRKTSPELEDEQMKAKILQMDEERFSHFKDRIYGGFQIRF
jgi:serine/threonine protein kinase